jgi:4-carboxymuconolactone decarboxylase
MPRVKQIREKHELPEDKHEVYDAIAQSRGGIVGPFPTLLHSAEVAARVAHLGHYLRFDSALPPPLREVAILAAARESDCDFEWAAHVRLGRQAGVPEHVIETIAERAGLTRLSPAEAVVIDYCRQLLGAKRVSQETFDAALSRFGVQGVVDLTALAGYYTMIACVLNAFEVLPPADAPRLP